MTSPADFNASVIERFRSNGGQVEGWSSPLLLLTSTGARSGQARVNPLAYRQGDGVLHVFASKGGAPTHPDWYHNLVAHPDVTVEVGVEKYEATAIVLTGRERDDVYAAQAAEHAHFGEYQEKTGGRVIPVVALKRKS